jgi:hypothetical protein
VKPSLPVINSTIIAAEKRQACKINNNTLFKTLTSKIINYLNVINKSVRFEAKLLLKWRFSDSIYTLVRIDNRFGIEFLT